MPPTIVTVPRRSQGVTDSPRKSTASIVAKRGAVLNSGVARATPASWILNVLNNRPRAKLNSPLSANHRKATTVSAGKASLLNTRASPITNTTPGIREIHVPVVGRRC